MNRESAFAVLISMWATLFASQVNAVPITIGSLSSNTEGTEIITDSLNNLEWLRWDVLKDYTYTQTVAATSAGAAYEGWNIADLSYAQLFMNALLGPNICDTTTSAEQRCYQAYATSYAGYEALVGMSYTYSQPRAWFLSDNGVLYEAGILGMNDSSNSHYTYKDNEWGSISVTDIYSGGYFSIPWLMYRTPPTTSGNSIPEPTTLALLSLGLVGLGFTRRRMKA